MFLSLTVSDTFILGGSKWEDPIEVIECTGFGTDKVKLSYIFCIF